MKNTKNTLQISSCKSFSVIGNVSKSCETVFGINTKNTAPIYFNVNNLKNTVNFGIQYRDFAQFSVLTMICNIVSIDSDSNEYKLHSRIKNCIISNLHAKMNLIEFISFISMFKRIYIA